MDELIKEIMHTPTKAFDNFDKPLSREIIDAIGYGIMTRQNEIIETIRGCADATCSRNINSDRNT